MIGILSRKILKIPYLDKFLEAPCVPIKIISFNSQGIDKVAVWGQGGFLTKIAKCYTRLKRLRYVSLEDGFLRSVELGHIDYPLSIVVDDIGLYLDANSPSRLELMISHALSIKQQERVSDLIELWQKSRVSKYNHQHDSNLELPNRFVLVIDQVLGDASISCGLANANSFNKMLHAAIKDNPHHTILIKVHPEVFTGRKKGYFNTQLLNRLERVVILGEDIHPASLLEKADKVYTVTSQLGFEALIWGKTVHTFGMPFYAGWGLTIDYVAPPKRRTKVTLEQLIYASLINYPRYVNPETGERCQIETIIEHIALQRSIRQGFPKKLYAYDFSYWKKPIIRKFFQGSKVKFVKSTKNIPANSTIVIWGQKQINKKLDPNTSLIRVEDGFLRSVGLGAALIEPISLVTDHLGIYFATSTESKLEYILENTIFDNKLLERAESLRRQIIRYKLTKYNIGSLNWRRPSIAKKVILVPGQVESDASIIYGSNTIKNNLSLLQAVREANPRDYIIYKIHPDIQAGLRINGCNENNILQFCNEVIFDVNIEQLFPLVDEVHVLTSLAGFEALLRNKTVVCYGQPFYSGWGLTKDVYASNRLHSRTLLLNELIAGTLILYPIYVSKVTGKFTTPERALEELITWSKTEKKLALTELLYQFAVKYFKACL
ncbi:Capsular polysaccharide biosynthesis protein [Candidatus Megaera polyxenophila]|jgi:capsular polysaccharide export protein|nr:Capsular polysaccharide biosynthesis protein [Candidatus Megaera polyxenophila]